jgi:Xaa-Pro aminopeptidase
MARRRFISTRPLEADRAEVEAAGIEVVSAPNMLADVEAVLERAGNSRIGSGPKRLLPYRLARRAQDLSIGDSTAMIDRLLMKKLDCEIEAMRKAAHLADEGYAVFRDAARPRPCRLRARRRSRKRSFARTASTTIS